MITVLAHPRVTGGVVSSDVTTQSLQEALTSRYDTDAHVCAYAPVLVDGSPVRAKVDMLQHGTEVHMVAMIGDLDAPNHTKTEEWADATREKLRAAENDGYAWYETRGGFRVLAPLAEPVVLTTPKDAEAWKENYLKWAGYMAEKHGVTLDPACKDFTRLYRLPNVVRDGQRTALRHRKLHGALKPWNVAHLGNALKQERKAKAVSPSTRPARDDVPVHPSDFELAAEVYEKLEESVEHSGGNEALYIAGRELVAALGPNYGAVLEALELYNDEKCFPSWDRPVIEREARRAVEWFNSRDGSQAYFAWKKRAKERKDRESAIESPWNTLGLTQYSFTSPPPPLEYICPGLRLAAVVGKICIIAAPPKTAKSPIADHLALCFALGRKAFHLHQCRKAKVLFLDAEGMNLTGERMARLCAADGIDPKSLDTAGLTLVDARDLNWSDDAFEILEATIKAQGIEVLILDSYTSATLGLGIEANSPEFALLAQKLGGLGVLVIALAHANKAAANSGGALRVSDIAYSMALGSLGSTIIATRRPDENDPHTYSIECVRAPHDDFESFCIRLSGKAPGPLVIEPVSAEETKAKKETDRDVLRSRIANRLLLQMPNYEAATSNAVLEGSGMPSDDCKTVLVDLSLAGLIDRIESKGHGRGVGFLVRRKNAWMNRAAPQVLCQGEEIRVYVGSAGPFTERAWEDTVSVEEWLKSQTKKS